MKRYIKPQIKILASTLTTTLLAGSYEGHEITSGMAKKDPFSFTNEQSAQKAPLQSDITINSVWE